MYLKILVIGIPLKAVILIALQHVKNKNLVEFDSLISSELNSNFTNYI